MAANNGCRRILAVLEKKILFFFLVAVLPLELFFKLFLLKVLFTKDLEQNHSYLNIYFLFFNFPKSQISELDMKIGQKFPRFPCISLQFSLTSLPPPKSQLPPP